MSSSDKYFESPRLQGIDISVVLSSCVVCVHAYVSYTQHKIEVNVIFVKLVIGFTVPPRRARSATQCVGNMCRLRGLALQLDKLPFNPLTAGAVYTRFYIFY